MMFSPDKTLINPRVAYAIGRSYGNAVKRNLVKRQCKAILREAEGELPLGRYLIGIRRSSAVLGFKKISDDINKLIARIGDQK
jgi:ribonuclease P protein component